MDQVVLFNAGVEEILQALQPETKPLWGQMNAIQMIEHLAFTIRLSTGDMQVDIYTPEEKWAKAKRNLLSDHSLPKLYRSPFLPEKPIPAVSGTIAEATGILLDNIRDFHAHFDSGGMIVENHPIFGPLTKTEWVVFHDKHFRHHLSQFGLLTEEG